MPPKNGNETDADEVSANESEHSNSTQGGHESSDEEANEIENDSDDSDMDANEVERRRNEYIEYMSVLERQFSQLREQYYIERMNQYEAQLMDVRSGCSEEYLQPLKELDKKLCQRIEVAESLRKYRLNNMEHKFLSEEQAAGQHFESEKELTLDSIYDDLMEKVRRLEEDRHNVDISWADWGTDKRTSKVRGPGRKKAVTVSGPYIVYMLPEEDILEDWTIIRKALKRTVTTTHFM